MGKFCRLIEQYERKGSRVQEKLLLKTHGGQTVLTKPNWMFRISPVLKNESKSMFYI